jgi:hypothetical protein
MDFYGNEVMARSEVRRRLADLDREAQRVIAELPTDAPRSAAWTTEFRSWVAHKARTGRGFMARTPANP